jgi:hypothetical protein
MPFGYSDIFEIKPQLPWQSKPLWADDEARKKLFGAELANHEKPFDAACIIFEKTTDALWAANNWLTDPIVLTAKNAHQSATNLNLLDKDALAHKLLKFAEEKDRTGQFYIVDAKDRLAALRLYAEIQGYIGKVDLHSTQNFINAMTIKFVKPENNNIKTIDEPIVEKKDNVHPLPLNIKLVSSR